MVLLEEEEEAVAVEAEVELALLMGLRRASYPVVKLKGVISGKSFWNEG